MKCARRNKRLATGLAAWGVLLSLALLKGSIAPRTQAAEAIANTEPKSTPSNEPPKDTAEARGRAKLLHETLHGVLQVVHRDFFREEEKLPIPSRSLEDVFDEMAESQNVKLRWLAVNTEAMNVDHKPKSEFDKQAVKVLAGGEESFESTTDGDYHYAGAIRLSASCLGCHLPSRGSNKDRAAALVISMPLKQQMP